MLDIIKMLTEWLEIKDHRIVELKELIMTSSNNPEKLRSIIDRQCEYREQTHCYSCGNEAGCLVLNGIGYLHLDEIEAAIKELETANLHFRNQDKTWNHIISLVLLGEAHEKNRKDHQALLEFEKAYNAIKLFMQMHSTEYIEKAILLEKILRDRVGTLSDKKTTRQDPSQIALPWMPIYTRLQLGSNGLIWIEDLPEGKSAFVAEIILDKSPHNLYSLQQDENPIALTKDKKYGWAKVSGDSMNGFKPMPILENDFVLFYKSDTADNNAIVIAAHSDNTRKGYQYVVKRYSQSIQSLVSETEPPNRYDPMPIIDEVRIIGVVIAVAKALN